MSFNLTGEEMKSYGLWYLVDKSSRRWALTALTADMVNVNVNEEGALRGGIVVAD